MDVNQALQEVLKSALIADGVVHGVDQVCKALDKRQAVLCILAENCDDERYKKLISALCAEHGIPLIKVDNNKKLGEWSGLCKIDSTGKARKIVGCSSVVISVSRNETLHTIAFSVAEPVFDYIFANTALFLIKNHSSIIFINIRQRILFNKWFLCYNLKLDFHP